MSDETDTMIDRALAGLPRAELRPELQARILADFTRQSGRNPGAWLRRQLDSIWPGVPLWQPVAALIVSLAIGLGIGVFTPVEFAAVEENAGAVSLDAPSFVLLKDG
jgi:hypothetical protein